MPAPVPDVKPRKPGGNAIVIFLKIMKFYKFLKLLESSAKAVSGRIAAKFPVMTSTETVENERSCRGSTSSSTYYSASGSIVDEAGVESHGRGRGALGSVIILHICTCYSPSY